MLPCRIVIADDHVLIREMIRKSIESIQNLQVVGEAGDGLECVEAVKRLRPDLVILDVTMPGMHGIGVIKEIKTISRNTRVLVLTMHKSKLHISRALSAGADGYLLKENAFDDMIQAIEKVRQGESYISELISSQVMELLREGNPRDYTQPTEALTAREKEILELVMEGKGAKEIADYLSISIMTVYNHRINIKKKMGVKKDIDLIRRALQDGYIPLQNGGSD